MKRSELHARRHPVVLCVAMTLPLAACSATGSSDPDTAATDVTTTAVTDAATTGTAPAAEPTAAPAAASSGVGDVGDVGDLVSSTVEVDGGDLPDELVAAYDTNGGDLVEPAEWSARYGTVGLPDVHGPGVRIVEATRSAERVDDGWERTDEMAWLTITNSSRDDLVAALAAAAAASGTAKRTERVDEGGDCVVDTYPPVDGVGWEIQACSYANFDRLIALGVSRHGIFAGTPTSIDPAIDAAVSDLGGTIEFLEVRFASPTPDGSTLHLSAHVAHPDDNGAATIAVQAGSLAGWQLMPGDRSALLSGPTGATWTIADEVAVFDWAGRW